MAVKADASRLSYNFTNGGWARLHLTSVGRTMPVVHAHTVFSSIPSVARVYRHPVQFKEMSIGFVG